MNQDGPGTYSRWLVSITALVAALLMLNYVAVSGWQKVAPGAMSAMYVFDKITSAASFDEILMSSPDIHWLFILTAANALAGR